MVLSHRRVLSGVGAAVLVVAIGSWYSVSSAGAVASAGPVKVVPASFTPWLARSHPNQNVQQLAQCGNTMYAVGTISLVDQGQSSYSRHNVFSFSATTGAVSSWSPGVSGSVHSIALSPDCSTAYLGGTFGDVGGVAAKNLAAVSTTTGALQSSFAHSASAQVDTLQYTHGVVLAGGQFTSINGTSRSRLASLDPRTGAVTGYADLSISGAYPGYGTKVYNSQLSHSGSKLLIEGVFTSIAGQSRQQVAVLDLGLTSVTVDGWHAVELNQPCSTEEAFYAKGANWSPDDSTIYIATTGYHGPGGANKSLCDAAAAFPATPTVVTHLWINYTGCDSLYSVAADTHDVYVGGHERWADNGHGCDMAGAGAVSRPGIGGLDPVTGLATSWNPTRSRGHGAQDLLITAAGLWVGSDTFTSGTEQMCGRQTNHGGICFLPYTLPIPAVGVPKLSRLPQVGDTTTCTEGTAPGETVSYAWNLDGDPRAAGPTFRPVASDYGKALSCTATLETSPGATSSATSPPVTVGLGAALTATTRPHLVGRHRVGATERVRHGTWSPTASTFTYRWYLGTAKLIHATRPRLRVAAADRGMRLTCRVTAHRPGYANGSVKTVAVTIT